MRSREEVSESCGQNARVALTRAIGMALIGLSLCSGCVITGVSGDPPDRPTPLRVGTSGDYAPFSLGTGSNLVGFDIAVAKAFAARLGRPIEWVPFRWPDLLADLEARRLDIAMGGITIRPERSLAGRYSLPVVTSGAVALVRAPERYRSLSSLDVPEARIAVNAGGHLERRARTRFRRARIETRSENADVIEALARGEVDAVITDTLEAPLWLGRVPEAVALGPFTRDRKAYLVTSKEPALARALDAWLLAREEDGSLARLRAAHLGRGDFPASTSPLPALLAAIDERLSLMPFVAESKRARIAWLATRLPAPAPRPSQARRICEATANALANQRLALAEVEAIALAILEPGQRCTAPGGPDRAAPQLR